MVRATNTGATALIDHRGQVTQRLPAHTRGVLQGEVQGRTGLTPFAVWVARAGLAPLWGLGLAVVALAWRRRAVDPSQRRAYSGDFVACAPRLASIIEACVLAPCCGSCGTLSGFWYWYRGGAAAPSEHN